MLNELLKAKQIDYTSSENLVNEAQVAYLKPKRIELQSVLNFIENRFRKLESQLQIVNEKLDKLLELVKEVSNDFVRIKNIQRDDEERIFKLCQSLDQKLDIIYKEQTLTIGNYIEEIKRWLDLWDLLDIESKKFLPIAEFIFDELNRIRKPIILPLLFNIAELLKTKY